MIARVWHGMTNLDKADQYLDFLLHEGTEEYRQTKGNLSARLWIQREQNCCHFLTVTEWEGLESIRAFAGEDYEKAKYYPQDNGVLLEFEEKVKHYECHDVSHGKIRNLLTQLEQLYTGGNWLDECFAAKLNDLDDELAFAVPAPGTHSIGEIVWHCLYWRTVLIKRLGGDAGFGDETESELNFLSAAKLREKTWAILKLEFDESQARIIALLKTKKDVFLEEEYKPGYSYNYLLNGIVQHDSYHLGQIGLVKSIIRRKLSG